MVFRKDAKVDSFQKQISALRQQLGPDGADELEPMAPARVESRRPSYDEPASPAWDTRGERSLADSRYGSADAYDATPVMAMDTPAYAPAAESDQVSVVAHDTVWTGDLQTNGSLHVYGQVKGSLTAKNDIYIAEEARVDAVLTAENVAIAGAVDGTIRCTGRFEVLPRGRVSGEILAPVLVIHEGAMIDGKFSMTRESLTADQATASRRRVARG